MPLCPPGRSCFLLVATDRLNTIIYLVPTAASSHPATAENLGPGFRRPRIIKNRSFVSLLEGTKLGSSQSITSHL